MNVFLIKNLMIKNLFYLPIFILVFVSNTFSDNTMNKTPQVINSNIAEKIKIFENKSTVTQPVPMQNNIKRISTGRISVFDRNNNNLSNNNIPVTQGISSVSQNVNTKQTKLPRKLNLSKAQLNQMNRIVRKHNEMLAQYNMNNPSSYTIPNSKPTLSNNTIKQSSKQTRSQKKLMKSKQQALNNKPPIKIINRQALQQQINTDSPIHRELLQKYNNRKDTSMKSKLQNIINTVNDKNVSNDKIRSLTNQWNIIVNKAVNSKLSKEYINNAIQTVINSSKIKSSNFYNNIIKIV